MSKLHIEVDTPILNYDGTPITPSPQIGLNEVVSLLKSITKMKELTRVVESFEKQAKDSDKVLTLKDAVNLALNKSAQPGSRMMLKAFKLSKMFFNNEVAKISLKDRKFILGEVIKVYNALVAGRVSEMLELEDFELEEKVAPEVKK